METCHSATTQMLSIMFLSYLWGMETQIEQKPFASSFVFLSYLWGMETEENYRKQSNTIAVLILPMRNGNFVSKFLTIFAMIFGSYPTYEEWKHNYNRKNYKLYYQFLSYLWGMETCRVKLILAMRFWVLILPMRNGNSAYLYNVSSHLSVLILPMRNGNFHF